MADQQFCLRWNNHQKTIVSVFDSLLEGEILVDCTLAAEGQFLRAHKVVLSACSPFFSDLLREHYEKHPILIMKDVKFSQLKAMLDYMYRGEVNISQDELGTFLKAAESLQIKGLSDSSQNCDSASKPKASPPVNRTLRSALRAPNDDSAVPRSKSTSPTPRKRKRRLHSESGEDIVTEDSASEPVVESNMSVPIQTNLNSITVKTSPQREDENSSPEAPGLNSNHVLSSSVSISFKNGSPRHQPPSLESSLSAQQNSEFLDADNVEDLTLDDGNVEAGPSHSSSEAAGFTWHVDRPSEENFLSVQDSHGGYRNAQGTMEAWRDYLRAPEFLCPQCNKKYKNRGTLIRHLRFECGMEAQFRCTVCNFSCKQRYNLTLHMRRHTREPARVTYGDSPNQSFTLW